MIFPFQRTGVRCEPVRSFVCIAHPRVVRLNPAESVFFRADKVGLCGCIKSRLLLGA